LHSLNRNFRVYFDLSYTHNTHENRITKPYMATFFCKVTTFYEKTIIVLLIEIEDLRIEKGSTRMPDAPFVMD